MLKRKLRHVLSGLTTATLALHTVLGCCWHHAHRCASCDQAVCVASPDGCHADHADGCCTAGSGGHGHHGRRECQGTTCVFMGPSRVDWQQFSFPLDAPRALLWPASGVALAVLPASPCFSPDALLPPLRLHLLDQVLLI